MHIVERPTTGPSDVVRETHSTNGLVGFQAKKTTHVIFPLKKHTRAGFLF
jgi:hypothetical protein